MKRLFIFLLATFMILAGCGTSQAAQPGTETSSSAADSEKEKTYEPGMWVTEDRYENEFWDIAFTLPDNWLAATAEELGYTSLEGNDLLSDEQRMQAEKAFEEGKDFVYIHVEAPDEMGHQGSVEKKVQAIEYLDQRVIGPLTKALSRDGTDYRLLVMPDHPTPIRVRTHTSDSVPYLLYDSTVQRAESWNYNEKEAKASGNFIPLGHTIIDRLLEK